MAGIRIVPVSWCQQWQRAFETDATDTSFTSAVDVTSEPSGDGIIELQSKADQFAPTWLMLSIYGTGDANDVIDFRINGIRRHGTAWNKVRLYSFTATLGAKTGAAGGLVSASHLYADTIASVVGGTADVNYQVHSPADDTQAYLLIDTRGCPKLQIQGDTTTGDATGFNVLYARL